MRVTLHMCMPSGDAMRHTFGEIMEAMKADNRAVVRAMLADGREVADTVGELGLRYVPEQHRTDASGRPVMDVYGVRDMVARAAFSCGCASAYEAAVYEEKYGGATQCLSVAQDEDDLHAVFVTRLGVVDPVANYLAGRRWKPPTRRDVEPFMCEIQDGRVVCVEPDICAVDERGVWHCPEVPGLSGRREKIEGVMHTPNGQLWARTSDGAVVPVTRRRR